MNTSSPSSATPTLPHGLIAFVGGGNMASAIIGGLHARGLPAEQLLVVEPLAPARERLQAQYGITALAAPGPALSRADLVVWAVKPQSFSEAAEAAAPFVAKALQLSVAAGIRSASVARWLGTERIVRTMPNTPALVGQGMTALFARAAVDAAARAQAEAVLSATGELMWVEDEEQLDAVTALSGSGPAYVFYFLEAMREAGAAMGLSPEQAYRLAVGTFSGASALARASGEPPEVLRERVTSKGGTTHAAITAMEEAGVKAAFERAMHAAHVRARELGDAFGR